MIGLEFQKDYSVCSAEDEPERARPEAESPLCRLLQESSQQMLVAWSWLGTVQLVRSGPIQDAF